MEVGPFSLTHSSIFLLLSGRSPDMTEILLTGTLSLNLINLLILLFSFKVLSRFGNLTVIS